MSPKRRRSSRIRALGGGGEGGGYSSGGGRRVKPSKKRKGEGAGSAGEQGGESKGSGEVPWYRSFVKESDALYTTYMEKEWGYPVLNDDRKLFEMLILEGAQAGLTWATVLKKREGYRTLFHNFEISKVADITPDEEKKLVEDARIIRHKGKIAATVLNAKVALTIIEEEGSLSKYLWSFVGGKPKINERKGLSDMSSKSPEAEVMSKALKKRGMKFVGPTICYAFMQACGMVIDAPIGTPQREAILKKIRKDGLE